MIDEGLVATEFEVERNRRGFLGWLGKIGIGTVGGVAGLMTTTTAAAACCSYRCCCLNYCPPNCPINSSGYYYCKSGYTMHSWTCCSGSPPFQRLYASLPMVERKRALARKQVRESDLIVVATPSDAR